VVYNTFFGLQDDPFRLTPDPAFLYLTVQHREALSGLVHAVCNRSGLTVLTGEVGTGKTTLLHVVRSWLKLRFATAVCTNPILTQHELLDLVLSQFGIPCSSSLKNRQLAALEDTLRNNHLQGRRSVLIVDEAHRLSPELLEEIRLLLNLETTREKLLEIVIAGQPELTAMLRRPDLRQLKQRVSYFCRLERLTSQEVGEYVQHRLAHAGVPNQTVFPEETLALVHQYTHGIPRLVNSLCDMAMQTAFALETRTVSCSIIDEAAADLDMLHGEPVPDNSDGSVFSPGALPVHAIDEKVNGHDMSVAELRMPMESYSERQNSLTFLDKFIGRWK
jgi:type II secretory pathway predicted ATPase ExeA